MDFQIPKNVNSFAQDVVSVFLSVLFSENN